MEDSLPLLSLKLLVPPLRVMLAVFWKVVCLRNIRHYGKVEEFVTLVTEAVPNIMTERQIRLLILGLRVKMLSSEQSDDHKCIKTYLSSLLSSNTNQVQPGNECLEANFGRLQTLLEDPERKEHFIKNVFPVEYGPEFDTALETLVCEFFTRLEELLFVPDFKQASVWISDTSSVLEEYMQCISKADNLKVLLRSKTQCGNTANRDSRVPSSSERRLFSSLSLPPSHETNINNMETDAQRQSEEISLKEVDDDVMQDTALSFEEDMDMNILGSSTTEQTAGGICRESIPNAQIVEECSSEVSPTCQTPPPSTENPVLLKSMIIHPRQRVAHKCPQCGKCFVYRYELVKHQRQHTGEHPYKCTQCGKAFKRTAGLSTHRRTECTQAAYVCIKCGDSFQSVQDRLRHRCGHVIKEFDCSQCGKSFKRKSSLGKHELTHTVERNLKCRQCGEAYPNMNELRSHQRIHPPEVSNQCKHCGKFFSSAASLTTHQLRHNQQKTHVCTLCGKACKSKGDLNLHTRTHTGERPFQCTYCGKCFSVSGNLNIHIRIHTGEKPYLCSDCGKAFISAGELQIHRRSHTGEKPYKCALCGRGFTMASKLTVHTRVHTGERPYVCSECGKGFSRSFELKKHKMKHTGDRPYTCHLCPKTYTCLNHLKRHLKTHDVEQN